MKCKYCGNTVTEIGNFCVICGARLAADEIIPPVAPVAAAASVEAEFHSIQVNVSQDEAPGVKVRQIIERAYTGPLMILIVLSLFAVSAATLMAVIFDVQAITGRGVRNMEVFMQLTRNALYFVFSLVSAIAAIRSLAFPLTKNINAFYAQRPFFTVRRVLVIIMMAGGTVFMVGLFILILLMTSAASALSGVVVGMYSFIGDNEVVTMTLSENRQMWQIVLMLIGIFGSMLALWIVVLTTVSGTYGRVKRYYHVITEAYTDSKYDIRIKPPYVRCFVVAGFMVIAALFVITIYANPTLLDKVISFFFSESSVRNASLLRTSMMFQAAALVFMGANLILNGLFILKYKRKLHKAFTNYNNGRIPNLPQ